MTVNDQEELRILKRREEERYRDDDRWSFVGFVLGVATLVGILVAATVATVLSYLLSK